MIKIPENSNEYNVSDNLTNGNDAEAAASGTDVFFQQKGSFSPAERRNYKDSVFVDLFYTDQNAGENLLSLYNALYDDVLTDIHALKGVRLENVLYMPFANDIAFTVESKKIILGEHQSTLNRNMPLRCLLYVAREYEQLVPVRKRFRTNAVKECIREGILSEYLERKSREVINMLIGEYDYEMDMQEKQEEIREEMQEVIDALREELNAKVEQAEARAEQAAEEKVKQLLCSLVQKGLLSVSEAAVEMGVSEEKFLEWIE